MISPETLPVQNTFSLTATCKLMLVFYHGEGALRNNRGLVTVFMYLVEVQCRSVRELGS